MLYKQCTVLTRSGRLAKNPIQYVIKDAWKGKVYWHFIYVGSEYPLWLRGRNSFASYDLLKDI